MPKNKAVDIIRKVRQVSRLLLFLCPTVCGVKRLLKTVRGAKETTILCGSLVF